jgi:hypothetical protein
LNGSIRDPRKPSDSVSTLYTIDAATRTHALVTKRTGSVVHVALSASGALEGEVRSIKVRARPLAELLEAKLHLHRGARPELSLDALVQLACDELEHAFFAQARRRFRSSFAAGAP